MASRRRGATSGPWSVGRSRPPRGGPAGPVHLNIGFREPLIPTAGLGALRADGSDGVPRGARSRRAIGGRRALAPDAIAELAARLASASRGLIVAGPQDDPALPAALARLAAATGFPIVADPLSGVRSGSHDRSHVLAHADHLVRTGSWRDAHRARPRRPFRGDHDLEADADPADDARPAQVVVDGDRGWSDPAILPTTFVHADATATATALADALEASGRAAAIGLGARLVRGGPGR